MNYQDLFLALKSCATSDGSSESALLKLEAWVGKRLPAAYRELLKRSNGVEGFASGGNYLVLWPVEQIAELNEAYSVSEFAPGLLLIGSDGSETGFALDTRMDPMPVKELPFLGMSHSTAKTVGENFESFLDRLKGTLPAD